MTSGDDSFPSLFPPFLPELTDFAINQWGTYVRPRRYDFPMQMRAVSPFTVVAEGPRKKRQKVKVDKRLHYPRKGKIKAARSIDLVDPIIPCQLIQSFFKRDKTPDKIDPIKENIYDRDTNSEMSAANALTCETFEFCESSYLVTFFKKTLKVIINSTFHSFVFSHTLTHIRSFFINVTNFLTQIFTVDKTDGSLNHIISSDMPSNIKFVSVSKDTFSWVPPGTSTENVFVLCSTETEIFMFKFCEGDALVFLSSVGFKCGICSAIIAPVDHPAITSYVLTRSGLTQWDLTKGKNTLNIISLDEPVFRGVLDPWLFVSFSHSPYQIFIASKHTFARVDLDVTHIHTSQRLPLTHFS